MAAVLLLANHRNVSTRHGRLVVWSLQQLLGLVAGGADTGRTGCGVEFELPAGDGLLLDEERGLGWLKLARLCFFSLSFDEI